MKTPVLKILIIKFSSIGDIILTTSPLKSIRREYPNAQIDFLTLDVFSTLLEGHPDIDQLLVLRKTATYSEIKRTGKYLREQHYNFVVDFHNTLRAKIIRRQLRNIKTYVLKKPRWDRFKLFYFHRNDFPAGFSQFYLLHTPINHLLTKSEEHPNTYLHISNTEKKWAAQYTDQFGVSDKYVVLIPGAAWPQKRWIIENYKALIQKLHKKSIGVVILGGKNDTICEDLSLDDPKIIDLHGMTDLRESLAIISNAHSVVGSDTGLLHGAEALSVPVVMITGPTSRETGAGANLSESIMMENNTLKCRPCSQNGKRKCYRKEQYCMTEITVDSVWNELKRLLEL